MNKWCKILEVGNEQVLVTKTEIDESDSLFFLYAEQFAEEMPEEQAYLPTLELSIHKGYNKIRQPFVNEEQLAIAFDDDTAIFASLKETWPSLFEGV